MKIVIVEDEPLLGESLEQKIRSVLGRQEDVSLFHQDYQRIFDLAHIDLVFMDIDLGEENGITLFDRIRNAFPQVYVVFMSSFPHYSQEIFESNPDYFLIKPIQATRLEMAFQKISSLEKEAKREFAFQVQGTSVRIKEREILYFQSDKRKILLKTMGDSPQFYEFYGKLDAVESELSQDFCRCHQSFILNLNGVKYLESKEFILQNKELIPISRNKYPAVKKQFTEFMGRI